MVFGATFAGGAFAFVTAAAGFALAAEAGLTDDCGRALAFAFGAASVVFSATFFSYTGLPYLTFFSVSSNLVTS